jgi:hypothetical protein
MERGEPNSDQAENAFDLQLSEITLRPLWSRKAISAALTSAAMTWTKFSRAASTALVAPKRMVRQRVREIANGRTTLSPFERHYEML